MKKHQYDDIPHLSKKRRLGKRMDPGNISGENTLTFLGAAREVTGSCHLLEANGLRILLDCGLLQGPDSARHPIENKFAFHPADIDAVILSHAHLDHCGMLPRLTHEGFNGSIYCTPGTRHLLSIMLMDAFHIYSKDLEYDNIRRLRAGKKLLQPAYQERDIKKVLQLCISCDYNEKRDLGNDITLSMHDAGHILGSSIVELLITRQETSRTLVFTGDLGNNSTSLMKDPDVLQKADVVLMESTYGDRNHRSVDNTMDEFLDVLQQTKSEHGNILIPAFSVGRTQELIFQLGKLYHQGKLDNWVVFLDSPMGKAVTEVYSHHLNQLDESDLQLLKQHQSKSLEKFLPCLSITETVEDSIAINRIKNGAIIIAGSGMCTGGRIRHHFKHRLWHANTHIIFTGYQAQGTLGRILINKPKTIKLFGQMIAVKAQIHTLGGFSAHADQQQLLAWAEQFRNKPQFYLVHGEDEALSTLQKALAEKHIHATIAEPRASITL